jgi:hypothetical protein
LYPVVLFFKNHYAYLMKYRTQSGFRKRLFLFSLCLFVVSALPASEKLSSVEQVLMDKTTQFRLALESCTSCEEAVEKIDAYSDDLHSGRLCPPVSGEVMLAVDNILVWEKYNCLYTEDIKHPALKGLITAQYERDKKWFKDHKDETHNKWMYETSADVLSCCLQFLPFTTALSEGLNIKKYYDAALADDPDMVFALINVAQWYYYAPAINGGGKTKTLNCLEHAVNKARNDGELYYARALLSQIEFDRGNTEKAAALLAKDEKMVPGSGYISHLQKINAASYSLFYYTVNRAKVDKKMAQNG